MKRSQKKYISHLTVALVIGFTLIFLGACTNVQHQATFNKNYLPKEDVRIKVAKVVNDTGYIFDVDIEQLLTNTLEEQLMEENLLNLGKTEANLFMESRIIGYQKGSAFKRWMMPGWGATELTIRCDLKDGKNNLVGTAMSSREVVAGGLYTVGAWETIFDDVADDVAGDLKHQIVAQGYVVKPKTPIQATAGSKDIEPGAQATDQTQESPKLASIPKEAPVVQVSLRRQPLKITNQMKITDMLSEYDFFDSSRNEYGAFVNDFFDNGNGTVTDNATGLMWQKSGSSKSLDNSGAKKYVKQLNKQRFAGYRDWRMPTVEELASLLTRRGKSGVHRAPVFDNLQNICWTTDECAEESNLYLGAWIVDFKQGTILEAQIRKFSTNIILNLEKNDINFVKAVRSVREKIMEPRVSATKMAKPPGEAPKSASIGVRDIKRGAAASDQTPEVPKLAAIPKDAPVERVALRRQPKFISNQIQIVDMLLEFDFFENSRNPYGAFVNSFVDNNDGTITDKATGLMWQKGGSSKSLDNRSAKKYVKQLNKQRFAGYRDWRMPTVEELASLLANTSHNGVHLASVFDSKRSACWTTDECDTQYYLTSGAWIVNFKQGQIQQGWYKKPSVTANFGITALNLKNGQNFVKAVRSVR